MEEESIVIPLNDVGQVVRLARRIGGVRQQPKEHSAQDGEDPRQRQTQRHLTPSQSSKSPPPRDSYSLILSPNPRNVKTVCDFSW